MLVLLFLIRVGNRHCVAPTANASMRKTIPTIVRFKLNKIRAMRMRVLILRLFLLRLLYRQMS
jgi:hypothetical protein